MARVMIAMLTLMACNARSERQAEAPIPADSAEVPATKPEADASVPRFDAHWEFNDQTSVWRLVIPGDVVGYYFRGQPLCR